MSYQCACARFLGIYWGRGSMHKLFPNKHEDFVMHRWSHFCVYVARMVLPSFSFSKLMKMIQDANDKNNYFI